MYAPIGLGSGICGLILVRDLLGLRTEIVGVQATGAPAYARSFDEGRLVALNHSDTAADGMAVRQPDRDAFAIIRGGASRIVTVSDEAIADARRKAELYAKAAGAKLGHVVSISEEGTPPQPRPMQAMRAGAVPIAPGEQTLRAIVSVSYELTP